MRRMLKLGIASSALFSLLPSVFCAVLPRAYNFNNYILNHHASETNWSSWWQSRAHTLKHLNTLCIVRRAHRHTIDAKSRGTVPNCSNHSLWNFECIWRTQWKQFCWTITTVGIRRDAKRKKDVCFRMINWTKSDSVFSLSVPIRRCWFLSLGHRAVSFELFSTFMIELMQMWTFEAESEYTLNRKMELKG